MNTDIKERWLVELRSDRYEQGIDYLCRGEKYCCLGVLCELAVADGITQKTEIPNSRDLFSYGNSCQTLDQGMREWAWFNIDDGRINELQVQNDIQGKNFKQIADWIEKHL
jgi:hypothetical protein